MLYRLPPLGLDICTYLGCICNCRVSVRPSVPAAAACGGFAAERRTGRRYGSIAAATSSSGAEARRSVANASSVALTADVGS